MKQLRPAIVLTLFFVLLTGLAFPGVVWAIGNIAFPSQAHGSLVKDAKGNVVGSSLLGQTFTKPAYFHPRPSAAGVGYDAASSGGTNLGPTSDKLVNGIKDDAASKDVDETYLGFGDLAKAYREENGLAADAVIPADAATRCQWSRSRHQPGQRRAPDRPHRQGARHQCPASASSRRFKHARSLPRRGRRAARQCPAVEPGPRRAQVA
jgi:K+-transporting ATPase KdpC subunit